jgi:hypothetical protein
VLCHTVSISCPRMSILGRSAVVADVTPEDIEFLFNMSRNTFALAAYVPKFQRKVVGAQEHLYLYLIEAYLPSCRSTPARSATEPAVALACIPDRDACISRLVHIARDCPSTIPPHTSTQPGLQD